MDRPLRPEDIEDQEVRRDFAEAGRFSDQAVVLIRRFRNCRDVNAAPASWDRYRNTDWFTSDGTSWKWNVRKVASCTWHRDMTVRSWRKGCKRVELQKLRAGFGDLALIQWTAGDRVVEHAIVDIQAWRDCGLAAEPREDNQKLNIDGTTAFVYYSLFELKKNGCLLEHWKAPVVIAARKALAEKKRAKRDRQLSLFE